MVSEACKGAKRLEVGLSRRNTRQNRLFGKSRLFVTLFHHFESPIIHMAPHISTHAKVMLIRFGRR